MASAGRMWAPVAFRLLRVATTKATKVIRTKLAGASKPFGDFHKATFKTATFGRQPIHPAAFLRQKRRAARWESGTSYNEFVSSFKRFFSGGNNGQRFDRSKFPKSNVSRRVAQFSGRAPFASTLRPNLTGGAIPRTASGYTLGGGSARYFSHGPAAPAEVIQNVSQAVRGFLLSGQRARFDGTDEYGISNFRTVSALQEKSFRQMHSLAANAPGAFIDFHLSPTITAFSPLAGAFPYPSALKPETLPAATLCQDGVLAELSADFGRAFRELAIIFGDLKRLSSLGDLPISLENHTVLRIRFPGVDAWTVERLCDDLGIQRGTVGEDAELDVAIGVPVALKFPFAPDHDGAKTLTSPGGSLRSLTSADSDIKEAFLELEDNPWFTDPEGYESLSPPAQTEKCSSDNFEGIEGIYRFLAECDKARDRF